MAGAWIAAVAQRLLHAGTFELIVSPAVADLQFEAPDATPARRLLGYAGLCAALGGAVRRDLRTDLHDLLDDAPSLAAVILVQMCYYTCLLALVNALPRPYLLATLASISVLAAVQTLVCFWPARRSSSAPATDD
jgi:hypothetical protein